MENGGERRGFSVKVLDARLRHLDCGDLWMVFDGWTETEIVWQRGLGFMRAEEVGTGGRGIRTGIRPESSLYLHLLPMWVLSTVPLFCYIVDCCPPSSSVHGIFPGKNTGVGCSSSLQGIFLTQGLNPCVLQ